MSWYRWDFGDNKDAEQAFSGWLNDDSDMISFSFGGMDSDIIALFSDGDWSWTKVPKLLDNKLRGRQKTLPRPTYVSTGIDHYYIHFADEKCEWVGPRSFSKAIDKSNSAVKKVAFAPHEGWYILFQDGSSVWEGLPHTLHSVLKRRKKTSRVTDISISPEGYWFVGFEDGDWRAHPPQECRRAIDSILKESATAISHVWLGAKGAYCILYGYYGKSTNSSPWKISYSQKSIPAHFSNGVSVWKAIGDIEKNVLDPSVFPPIHVIKKDDRLVTLDNRRLFVFQNASVSSIQIIIIDKPYLQAQCYYSVKVSSCKCTQCSFGGGISDQEGKRHLSKNTTSDRSWTWAHFLETSPPPSVLLCSA